MRCTMHALHARPLRATRGRPHAPDDSSPADTQTFLTLPHTPHHPPPLQSDPGMAALMQSMHNPAAQANIEEKLKALKDDPDLAPVLAEIETGGPAAMMKYWDDPSVLEKLSKAMGSAFGAGGPPGGEGEGDAEDEEEGEPTVHTAASAGDVDTLKELLGGGADADAKDEEGRTALHFSAGYGERACVDALLAAGAALNGTDDNDNTPLHYAAGYGQPAIVQVLLDAGADGGAVNKDGKTPAEVAALNGADDIVAMFKNDGGDDKEDGAKEEDKEEVATA